LQLLVERAQYITGATGTALALPSGEEMVCRASAGTSAPPVGARLQAKSGLTGESMARRQLLRCDNAELDPRVNLETCRQMGIASIVVMPLLRPNGEIRGLFELFSDHAYAFEERDLGALERMADLTLTALDLAEGGPGALPGFAGAGAPAPNSGPAKPRIEAVQAPAVPAAAEAVGVEQGQEIDQKDQEPGRAANRGSVGDKSGIVAFSKPMGYESVAADLFESSSPTEPPAPVPEAMLRVQKCVACGFPVSEGRTYCLDCERKDGKRSPSLGPAAVESVPGFLDVPEPPEESWLANHVNLLAVVVLILGILVAIVVFR